MSTGIDIQFVREHYQQMTDDELIKASTSHAGGLTPEALEVVKEEIIKRKLNTGLLDSLDAQNTTYSIGDIDKYCAIVRDLYCPGCGTTIAKLNGTMTSEVMSFVFFTQSHKKLKIACPNCLDKANEKALSKTLVFGWWGIPWGIINTVQAIKHNLKSKKTNHDMAPNGYLRSYVLSRIGEFEAYKDDEEKLQEIIAGN